VCRIKLDFAVVGAYRIIEGPKSPTTRPFISCAGPLFDLPSRLINRTFWPTCPEIDQKGPDGIDNAQIGCLARFSASPALFSNL
jgi:hypothetical protein